MSSTTLAHVPMRLRVLRGPSVDSVVKNRAVVATVQTTCTISSRRHN